MDWTIDRTSYPAEWAYGEALRLAIIERAAVVGVSVPTSLTKALVPAGSLHLGDTTHYYPYGWLYANDFDYLLTTLIPYFVNHTNLGGDWAGQADQAPAPAWTEAAILTAIGAGARLYQRAPPATSPPNPYTTRPVTWAWMKQQYDILNMLRWSKQTASVAAGEHRSLEYTELEENGFSRDTPEEAWALAKLWAPANCGGWGDHPDDDHTMTFDEGPPYYGGYSIRIGLYIQSAGLEQLHRNYPGYTYYRYMNAWRAMQHVQPIATGIPTALAHAAQLYARTVIPDWYKPIDYGGAPTEGVRTYVDPNGRTENHYFVHQSWPATAINRHVADWVGPDPRLGPPTEPWCDIPIRNPLPYGNPDKENVIGSQIKDFTYVLKWDVSGGLAFITP
jgi:hypothetical protein